MSEAFRVIKVTAVPLLFAAAALGLAAVQISLERKAGHARSRAAHTVAVQDSNAADKLAGIKLQDLAPAAQKGDVAAEVEMARRLALGEGVKKDEAQAALYFQAVINQLGEIGARDRRAPLAATAFRFLAQFQRRGVPEANINANPAYAFDLLHHAASYFGDPAAQFELAKLLIDGDGLTKNTRVGAQWLLRATQKGYAPAQALLGDMLWRGNGVKRFPGEGLGLLAIARRNACPADKPWVSKMFEAARAEASPIEILEANTFIVQESGTSPFSATAGRLAEELSQEGTMPASNGAESAPPVTGESSAPAGGAKASALRAKHMFFRVDSYSSEFGARKPRATSAGIIQMYRLGEEQAAAENAAPVRIAGVVN